MDAKIATKHISIDSANLQDYGSHDFNVIFFFLPINFERIIICGLPNN